MNLLFVTNPENFKIFVEKGILGFKTGRRKQADKAQPGDQLVCYIGGEKKIGGIMRLESDMYEDRAEIFTMKTPEEIYPWRFKCSTVMALPTEKQIHIEYFFNKLEMFAKFKSKYLALQGQVHYLSDHDFEILEAEILKAS